MWPFMAASGLTFYLVSLMQDAGVKCEYTSLLPSAPVCARRVELALTERSPGFVFIAEAYKNDPRNPYAAQISKEEAAHH